MNPANDSRDSISYFPPVFYYEHRNMERPKSQGSFKLDHSKCITNSRTMILVFSVICIMEHGLL
ncbi:hypothetical protein Mapa_003926 [Marchantia paleacea]|nr:hypothetical protein Mapa_003926 [Marchantia paleacea]